MGNEIAMYKNFFMLSKLGETTLFDKVDEIPERVDYLCNSENRIFTGKVANFLKERVLEGKPLTKCKSGVCYQTKVRRKIQRLECIKGFNLLYSGDWRKHYDFIFSPAEVKDGYPTVQILVRQSKMSKELGDVLLCQRWFKSLKSLEGKSFDDLLFIRGMGKTRAEELVRVVKEYGIVIS